jgi:serine O-acetyltransferase
MNFTQEDLFRYSGRPYSTKLFCKYFFTHPGFRFVVTLRFCQRFKKWTPIGMLSRIYFKRLQRRFGFQIPHSCKIGGGLFLGHFGNIVVNQGVQLGRNCNIAQGATIGYISRGSKTGCPKIGNRVWIGPNAVIVGNISVGDDVLIAPLSLVTCNIPDGSVVQGNPAKVISSNGSAGYIKNYDSKSA